MAAIADGLLVMVAIALRIAGGIYLDSLPHVLAIRAQSTLDGMLLPEQSTIVSTKISSEISLMLTGRR